MNSQKSTVSSVSYKNQGMIVVNIGQNWGGGEEVIHQVVIQVTVVFLNND